METAISRSDEYLCNGRFEITALDAVSAAAMSVRTSPRKFSHVREMASPRPIMVRTTPTKERDMPRICRGEILSCLDAAAKMAVHAGTEARIKDELEAVV
jgi:hypothetical protein